MLDLVIRNGLVVDGSGLPGFKGDLAIAGGKIAAVGNVGPTSARTIDARGRVISPGFIDPHTHFDAQLSWDPHAQPSVEHGITSIVPGNCSLSLAPLRTDQRDAFIRMFRQIEEMPAEDFGVGVDWAWGESFPGWTEHLTKRGLGIHVAPLVGHSVIRMFVMGDAANQRVASADEIAAMCRVLDESLEGGALYNLACLYLHCNAPSRGMEHLRRAVQKGVRDIEAFRRDPDLEPLRGTVEFEELMKEVEASNV